MNLPVNAIIRLRHTRSGDSQGQESFLAPSTDNQIIKPATITYVYQHQLLKYRRSIFTE